MAVELDNADSV